MRTPQVTCVSPDRRSAYDPAALAHTGADQKIAFVLSVFEDFGEPRSHSLGSCDRCIIKQRVKRALLQRMQSEIRQDCLLG